VLVFAAVHAHRQVTSISEVRTDVPVRT